LRSCVVTVTCLVVHLKSGSDGRELRARQLVALGRVIARVALRHDHLVVLGDFNATEQADRSAKKRRWTATSASVRFVGGIVEVTLSGAP